MFALRRAATRAFAARAGAQRVALRAFANQCPHDPSKPYHKSPLPLEAAGGLLEYSVVYTDRAMNHMSKPFCKVRPRPPNAPSAVPRPARPRPRARARRKNIPSRCLSTRPPTSGRTNHERKRRARRSRTAREANAAPRDVRDARVAAVLRARAHRRSRTRDPRARSPRTPPCVFTVSSAPYPSQTATSRTHPASAPPVNNGRPRRFFFHAASQRRRLASRDADASDPPFPLARRS